MTRAESHFPLKMIAFEGTVTAAALRLTSGEILKRRNSWQ